MTNQHKSAPTPNMTSAKHANRLAYTRPVLHAQGDVRQLTQSATMHMGSLFGLTSPGMPGAPTR